MLARHQRNRNRRRDFDAGIVEDVHEDVGRFAGAFDDAEVRAIRRRLRDLLQRQHGLR